MPTTCLLKIVICIFLLTTTGCITNALDAATDAKWIIEAPSKMYVTAAGDLVLEQSLVNSAGKPVHGDAGRRFRVYPRKAIADEIARHRNEPTQKLPFTLRSSAELRHVSLVATPAGMCTVEPHLLDHILYEHNFLPYSGPPPRRSYDVNYRFADDDVDFIIRENLTRYETSHAFSQKPLGGKIVFIIGVVPAVVMDVICFPIEFLFVARQMKIPH